jgi:short-chain fatty acids transporter
MAISIIPAAVFWLGKKVKPTSYKLTINNESNVAKSQPKGAERLDKSAILGVLFGIFILVVCVLKIWRAENKATLSFIDLELVNLTLFGLAVLLHVNFKNFVNAIEEAVKGASGIIIQFPLYAGIMGIMYGSGLLNVFADFFVAISKDSPALFPFFTMLSAGLVNICSQWGWTMASAGPHYD